MQGGGQLVGPSLVAGRCQDGATFHDRQALDLIRLQVRQAGRRHAALKHQRGPPADHAIVGHRNIHAPQQVIAEVVDLELINFGLAVIRHHKGAGHFPFPKSLEEFA
ncbi:MAG: hypothetical protein CFE33_00720 [Pseudorhodobacter sp. PARRP1]|nr:MAG: hypothetical protein CFE33_00720 [Pseudorhodobacter sp. PARRP1]